MKDVDSEAEEDDHGSKDELFLVPWAGCNVVNVQENVVLEHNPIR